MTLVERQMREMALNGARRFCVWISPRTAALAERLRPDLDRLYQVERSFTMVAGASLNYHDLAQVREEAVVLEGDVLYDDRILTHLLLEGPGCVVKGGQGTSALYLDAAGIAGLATRLRDRGSSTPGSLGELLQGSPAGSGLRAWTPGDLDFYVPSLRLTMEPYMVRVVAADQLRRLDRLMYRRTFKGAIDAVARYGYYHPVRWLTRQLSRTSLPPNLVTVLSLLCIWAAIPCFACGLLGAGALVAWAGVILDSVDGKLARLRLHLSARMGALEHVLAAPGLGLWYIAWGWHLSAGELLAVEAGAVLTWTAVAAFVLDKVVSGGFRICFGREIFDYRPLDAVFHLFAARRNVTLLIMTAGAASGREREAFQAIAAWTLATLLFHASRFAWVAASARIKPTSRIMPGGQE